MGLRQTIHLHLQTITNFTLHSPCPPPLPATTSTSQRAPSSLNAPQLQAVPSLRTFSALRLDLPSVQPACLRSLLARIQTSDAPHRAKSQRLPASRLMFDDDMGPIEAIPILLRPPPFSTTKPLRKTQFPDSTRRTKGKLSFSGEA
ncbi:hypothetical protein CKAH01_11890 [Colletotrichum kahawae]|uniref:Uncharacterized protein n=1 Tax=Colletotrichum kahawae TaxID=34407 RepID=A0AAD9YVL6_COLKA|nr:hypothetical protein CKAH01_11890 [Colletotrichum kahawae]